MEWAQLLEAQQRYHDSELQKWREIIKSSVVLLDQVKANAYLQDANGPADAATPPPGLKCQEVTWLWCLSAPQMKDSLLNLQRGVGLREYSSESEEKSRYH